MKTEGERWDGQTDGRAGGEGRREAILFEIGKHTREAADKDSRIWRGGGGSRTPPPPDYPTQSHLSSPQQEFLLPYRGGTMFFFFPLCIL